MNSSAICVCAQAHMFGNLGILSNIWNPAKPTCISMDLKSNILNTHKGSHRADIILGRKGRHGWNFFSRNIFQMICIHMGGEPSKWIPIFWCSHSTLLLRLTPGQLWLYCRDLYAFGYCLNMSVLFLALDGKGHVACTPEMSRRNHCWICDSHVSLHHRQSHKYFQTTKQNSFISLLIEAINTSILCICTILGIAGSVCSFIHLSSLLVWGRRPQRVRCYAFQLVPAQCQSMWSWRFVEDNCLEWSSEVHS